MKERIFIVIDGNNFYHRLKELELENLLNFNYEKFSKFLAGERSLILKKYYIGSVREETGNLKSRKLMRDQRILMSRLKKYDFKIGFGHMLKTDKYHEKGVDVLMAVDLLVGAYENLYDTAILVSSDTDLLPAILKIRQMKKKVEYVGFSPKPSYGLISCSDIRRLFSREDILPFVD